MKDPRYKAIKSLIEAKGITRFKDIFTIVPLTVVKRDMKINYNTLRSRVNKVETLTFKDIITMADLFEVNAIDIFHLILNDIGSNNKGRKK